MCISLAFFMVLNREDMAADLMDCIGIRGWTDDVTIQSIATVAGNVARGVMDADKQSFCCLKLCAFLALGQEADDISQMQSWMPSPTELAEMAKKWLCRVCCVLDVLYLGCLAYMKLDRDDDAYELASIAVSPEQATFKKIELVNCRSILGQIAAKRGNLKEADGHFAKALEEARFLSCLPMLEVLASQRWKQHLLVPNGRDTSAADAAIDAACAKMKKSRDDLASVLI